MIRSMVVSVLLGFPMAMAAQSPPLITDRPDQTESAATVPLGALQIEVGALSERSPALGGHLDAQALGGALLRYGLHARVEARFGIAGWQRTVLTTPLASTTVDGMGDLEAGFKVVLSPPTGSVELALLGSATLPSGADAFSSGRVDPRVRVSVATPLAERIGLGVNAGMMWSSSGPTAPIATRSDALYTAVLGFSLTDRVSAFAESFGTLPVSTGGAAEHLLDGGITVLLTPTLQLDASGGIGLNANAADWFIGAGVSVRVGR